MAARQACLHLRTNGPDENGGPKQPTSEILNYGELALNYHKGSERIFLKNDSGEIISFSPGGAVPPPTPAAGANTVTTLAKVPITKPLVIANISVSAEQFTLAGKPKAGKDVHIIVNNKGTAKLVVSLPNNNTYKPVGPDVFNIEPGKIGEINAVSDGTVVYIRVI